METRTEAIENLYYKLRNILNRRKSIPEEMREWRDSYSYYAKSTVDKKIRELEHESKKISNEFIINLANFQRELEFIFEDARKLGDSRTEPYIERMDRILNEIIYLTSSVRYERLKLAPGVRQRIYEDFSNVYESFQDKKWTDCIRTFDYIQGEIYEFLADLRLLYRLRIFPLERKVEIRDKLSNLDFVNVVECLVEADENVISGPKHYKDCADRCREALEKLVKQLTIKVGEKPSKFELNMVHLQKKGVFELPTKLEIVAFFAYLGQVGPHGILRKKLSDNDVNYVMDETYRKISRILEKFDVFSKKKS